MTKPYRPDPDDFTKTLPPASISPLAVAVMTRWAEIASALRAIPQSPSPDQLLDGTELAQLLSVSKRTLESWRADGRGPKVTRVGGNVRYKYRDVIAWITEQNPDV